MKRHWGEDIGTHCGDNQCNGFKQNLVTKVLSIFDTILLGAFGSHLTYDVEYNGIAEQCTRFFDVRQILCKVYQYGWGTGSLSHLVDKGIIFLQHLNALPIEVYCWDIFILLVDSPEIVGCDNTGLSNCFDMAPNPWFAFFNLESISKLYAD